MAKGVDYLAQGIREKATENGVAIFAPTLARALYFTTELDEPIPEALYYAVAQVIVYVFSLNSLDRNASVADRPDPEVPFGMRYNTDGTKNKELVAFGGHCKMEQTENDLSVEAEQCFESGDIFNSTTKELARCC